MPWGLSLCPVHVCLGSALRCSCPCVALHWPLSSVLLQQLWLREGAQNGPRQALLGHVGTPSPGGEPRAVRPAESGSRSLVLAGQREPDACRAASGVHPLCLLCGHACHQPVDTGGSQKGQGRPGPGSVVCLSCELPILEALGSRKPGWAPV